VSAGSKSENRREFDIVKFDTYPSALAFVTLGLNLPQRVSVLLAQRGFVRAKASWTRSRLSLT